MPFRPPSPSDGPLAKVDCLAEKDPVTVREDHLADVELVAVAVSDPQKVRYGGLAEKEGVDEGSRVGRLRRTTEAALVKTWSYELAATTRFKGVGEAMRVGSKYADDRIVYFDPPAEHVAAYNLPSHGRSTGVRKLEAKPA